MPGIAIDVSVEAGAWPAEDELQALCTQTMGAALDELAVEVPDGCELSVLFTDDAHIRVINRDWRGQDKATNVLSFPAIQIAVGDPVPELLGDIALARETLEREAADEGKPLDHHLRHLLIHGFLHLLGHDHVDDAQAETMEACERRILARLAIPDPYA